MLDQAAIEHIRGSGMDPRDLAKRYGTTHHVVNLFQMGREEEAWENHYEYLEQEDDRQRAEREMEEARW